MGNGYLNDYQQKNSKSNKSNTKIILLRHKDSGYKRHVKLGFSWTALFFGALVPLFRGHIKWFFIYLIGSLITLGIFWLVFPFFYNREYIRYLLENGYKPASRRAQKKLKKADML